MPLNYNKCYKEPQEMEDNSQEMTSTTSWLKKPSDLSIV